MSNPSQPGEQRQRPRTSETGGIRVPSGRKPGATRKKTSKAVYRRRRLVVFGVLIIVIGLVAWGIWQASRPSTTVPTPTPSDGAAPIITEHPDTGETIPPALQVTPAPISEVPPKCTAEDAYVEALTTHTDFGPGAAAQLGIAVTSQIGTPCSINIGTAMQKYTVKSGNDIWWRSTDCQIDGVDQIVTLEPGQRIQTDPFLEWDRVRSAPDTCESNDREQAKPGFYALEVEIGGLVSQKPADFGVWIE